MTNVFFTFLLPRYNNFIKKFYLERYFNYGGMVDLNGTWTWFLFE